MIIVQVLELLLLYYIRLKTKFNSIYTSIFESIYYLQLLCGLTFTLLIWGSNMTGTKWIVPTCEMVLTLPLSLVLQRYVMDKLMAKSEAVCVVYGIN
jgi:hypothetical protein